MLEALSNSSIGSLQLSSDSPSPLHPLALSLFDYRPSRTQRLCTMSGRSLSKGTLGLKFMNKVQPKPLISDDSAPAASSSGSATTSKSAATSSATGKGKQQETRTDVKMEVDEKLRPRIVQEGNDWSRPAATVGQSR